ncbi:MULTISPECIES: zinc-binding dehydrogenase [Nonomuraea]|uniref:Zinc-binding dehydrogenase n=1 Tax=Nonomuraea mangrovi TaxID=2316207 RepID=A0ABW4SPX1_9ACTN
MFVTGAAGGVGSLAGQLARLRGATRVIGSTGSQCKGQHLIKELGYDAVVIRGAGPIEDQLRAAAPDGIDAVFDHVGGEQLSAVLAVARRGARVALVGTLSSQISGDFTAPIEIDTGSLILRGITLRGMSGSDHLDAIPQAMQEFGRALREGTLTFPHTCLACTTRRSPSTYAPSTACTPTCTRTWPPPTSSAGSPTGTRSWPRSTKRSAARLPALGHGGHLVLLTGHDHGLIHFHNPCGHTPDTRQASLPLDTFEAFFGGRGIALRMHQAR